AQAGENFPLIHVTLRVEAIVGCPVLLGAVLAAQQAGDGVAAKANQVREQMSPTSGQSLRGGEAIGALLDQVFDLLEEKRVFFLRSTGCGGTISRARMRWPLSATVQWTHSPLAKSMAWAMGAGKLMYHC